MRLVSIRIIVGIVAVIAGLLIILIPNFLEWVIGISLLIIGILLIIGKK